MKRLVFAVFLMGLGLCLKAQIGDTINLNEVRIIHYKAMNGVGRMNDYADQIIYAGKKTEVLQIDSLDANKAINNTRQIIGRIPGVNIIETESGGFTANGIAFRGLNPYQSIETNTRQNGYNVSADIFGYNEAYYLPPMEAVKTIQFVRGASCLQFGPQIGGMINYVLKDAPKKSFEFTSSQTGGSYGMFNSYNSIGGTLKKFKYFGFLQYRHMDGWRANSNQTQVSGFAKLQYDFSSKFSASVEYTMLRNLIHMPGGLTDSMFVANPKQSGRSRNWLTSPWNIISASLKYKFNENTSVSLKSTYLFSQRNLVWRNEEGWPDVKDTITSNKNYVPREVEREYFKSISNELRFLTNYKFFSNKNTLSFGMRHAYSNLKRQEGADGSAGSNYDLKTYSDYPVNLSFYTTNIAPFVENTFNMGKHFSITPGVRFEYLSTTANGYTENQGSDSNVNPFLYSKNLTHTRTFLMSGLGLQYKICENNSFYANYSQSYKPVTYSDLTPFGTVAKVDQNLKDAYADNADIGFRGMLKNILNFDISVFYINYKNRIGYVLKTQDTLTYLLRTNTGSSEHKGAEAYVELNLSNWLFSSCKIGKISLYNSFAYVDARYISGDYAANRVEYAPKYINRSGLNYSLKGFSINAQYSYQSDAFGDAANTVFSHDALVGKISSYSIIDVSASYKYKKYQLKAGVNNVRDKKYFTLRTPEYPGPGIIPSTGRMVYVGVSGTF